MKYRIAVLGIVVAYVIALCPVYAVDDTTEPETTESHGAGLSEMTAEQWETFRASLPEITQVFPNEIALSRTPQPMRSNDTNLVVAPIGDEVIFDTGSPQGSFVYALPEAVDVSEANTFPPIEDQGNYESCVAWSLAYYQLTNNTCVVRGVDARSGSRKIEENIMSPRWAYSLINVGKNIPTFYDEACAAIFNFGCPSWDDFSGDITSSNLKQWSTDTDIWYAAMKNKPESISYEYLDVSNEPISDPDDERLSNLKQLLANGYVVTFPTYVNSFVYTKSTSNSQWGLKYMKDTQDTGHAMTIVGYDDAFWVDVNGNGRKNTGETGAFKVANSWGTSASNYTNGYLWIPYDALNEDSSVSGAPSGREPVFTDYYFIQPRDEYEPLYVAEVEITAAKRDQIAVEIGVTADGTTIADEEISVVPHYNIAFNYAGQGFAVTIDGNSSINSNFTGGTSKQTITLPVDLTPVVLKCYENTGLPDNSNLRLFVSVSDEKNDGYNTQLGTMKVHDAITGNTVTCTNSSVLMANGTTVTKYVDLQTVPFMVSSHKGSIELKFSAPVDASSVTADTFYLKDSKGNKLSHINTFVYGSTVEIVSNDLEAGQWYELTISPSILSRGQNTLVQGRTVPIYVLEEYNQYW